MERPCGCENRRRRAGTWPTSSTLLHSCRAAMVLMLLLGSSAPSLSLQRPTLIGRDTAAAAAAQQRGAGVRASPCTWTPFLLPPEAQQWALGAAREEVVTLVKPMRRHLTAQLAAGVLLQVRLQRRRASCRLPPVLPTVHSGRQHLVSNPCRQRCLTLVGARPAGHRW